MQKAIRYFEALFASGTKVFALNAWCLVSTTQSFKRFENFSMIHCLPFALMATLPDPHLINAGVPQGSAITPILFNLYIQDIIFSTSSSIRSIADDTYLASNSLHRVFGKILCGMSSGGKSFFVFPFSKYGQSFASLCLALLS